MSTVLEVNDLTVAYPPSADPTLPAGRPALRGVSLQVRAGEVLGVVGESGSGKSTLALALLGLLPDSARVSGEVRLAGQSLLGADDATWSRLRGRMVSMVFQDPYSSLTPVYPVGDQIAEAIRLHQPAVSRAAARSRAVQLLELVGFPDPSRGARAFPHQLSGGMRQRVLIAMAVAHSPRLIVADEPTTALDVTVQAQVLEVLRTARQLTGAALLLVTHDLGVIAEQADRVAVMYAGRVVETAPVEQVFAHPRMPYTAGLLGAVPVPPVPGTARRSAPPVPLPGQPPQPDDPPPGCPFHPRCRFAQPSCTQVEPPLLPAPAPAAAPDAAPDASPDAAAGSATWVACLRAAGIDPARTPADGQAQAQAQAPAQVSALDPGTGPPLLSVEGLVHRYPDRRAGLRRPFSRGRSRAARVDTSAPAVDGVSFELTAGGSLALVGESGCGKTTTMRRIMDLRAPQAGTVRIGGLDVARLTPDQRRRLRGEVQLVFQDPSAALDPRLTVADIVGEPLTVRRGRPAVPEQPEQPRRTGRADRAQEVARALELVGLPAAAGSRYPHELSGGERQRVGIARALVTRPSVLLLDEPLSSLDVSVQAGIVELLNQLRRDLQLSYLVVAHDLAAVAYLADTVAVMYQGRIVESGPLLQVYRNPRHGYTAQLLAAIPVPDPTLARHRRLHPAAAPPLHPQNGTRQDVGNL